MVVCVNTETVKMNLIKLLNKSLLLDVIRHFFMITEQFTSLELGGYL